MNYKLYIYSVNYTHFILFFQFCDVVEVTIIHNQIWLHTRYENRKETKILLYSWLPIESNHKNMVIWKNILWNLAILGHFIYENSFA
jgi:hypothetical protein